ncbi:MAG: rRNA pseudouridine synthase [Erysipelotrichaceae bacterium]|nr:rRNA pseudouridine synthase [Erysipelotrichaceae bacterium]
MERLQKIIADSGICSRRKAEELIRQGKVTVNGKTVTELGYKADADDEIRVDSQPLNREEKVVFLLHKPKNVISSVADDRGRRTVLDLVDTPYRLYPVGRLDYGSSGLLLLTNDGELMQEIIHPRYEIDKTYHVVINGLISEEEIQKLETGVMIDGRMTAPCTVKLLRQNENKKSSQLEMVIHEGRNRQIRKMMENIGYEVTKLHRTREACIELGDLKAGEYRQLKPHEIKKLKAYLNRRDR